jgi:hypothetical protein
VTDHHLTSKITWNDSTSELSATFTRTDIDAVRDLLDTRLDFKIGAIIPGSEGNGATTTLDNLVTASFSINLLDSSLANECKANILMHSTTTFDGEARDSTLTFKIPASDVMAPDAFEIPALAVEGILPQCGLTTIVQYYDEWGCDQSTYDETMASGTATDMECNGAWYEFYD